MSTFVRLPALACLEGIDTRSSGPFACGAPWRSSARHAGELSPFALHASLHCDTPSATRAERPPFGRSSLASAWSQPEEQGHAEPHFRLHAAGRVHNSGRADRRRADDRAFPGGLTGLPTPRNFRPTNAGFLRLTTRACASTLASTWSRSSSSSSISKWRSCFHGRSFSTTLARSDFWSMMLFLGVLTIGFVYEWNKGALEWD